MNSGIFADLWMGVSRLYTIISRVNSVIRVFLCYSFFLLPDDAVFESTFWGRAHVPRKQHGALTPRWDEHTNKTKKNEREKWLSAKCLCTAHTHTHNNADSTLDLGGRLNLWFVLLWMRSIHKLKEKMRVFLKVRAQSSLAKVPR